MDPAAPAPAPAPPDLQIPHLTTMPTYADFLETYLVPNRPVLLPYPGTGAAAHPGWPCLQDWATASLVSGTDECGRRWCTPLPDWMALAERYADHLVPVVRERRTGGSGEEEEVREERAGEVFRALARGKDEGERVYVKDWHLVRVARGDGRAGEVERRWGAQAQETGGEDHAEREREWKRERDRRVPYTVPDILSDDWLNPPLHRPSSDTDADADEDADEDADDFQFCYAGTAGTSTRIHRDVYASYSWSTNVIGTKRWHLWPPSVSASLLRDPTHTTLTTGEVIRDLPTLLARLSAPPPHPPTYPDLAKALANTYTVTQPAGTTLFVPSGWYHAVRNLTPAVSLNRNWCNAVALPRVYAALRDEVHAAVLALEDVRALLAEPRNGGGRPGWEREWWETVLRVVRLNAGWEWEGFWRMVRRGVERGGGVGPGRGFVRRRVAPIVAEVGGREEWPYVSSRCREDWTAVKAWVESEGEGESGEEASNVPVS